METITTITCVAAATALLIGCGGSSTTPDPGPKEGVDEGRTEAGGSASLSDCKRAVGGVETWVDSLDKAHDSGVDVNWSELDKALDGWTSETHPCLVSGSDDVQRGALYRQASKKLLSASYTTASKQARGMMMAAQPQKAIAILRWAYLGGELASTDLRDLAGEVTSKRDGELLAKFKAQKTWAQTDAGKTVCIFSNEKIDPSGEPVMAFQSSFVGDPDVHTLCRTPKPAEELATEGDGELVLVLHRDNLEGLEGKQIAQVPLGTLGKWKTSSFFRGRFSMPQGIDGKTVRAHYTVVLELRRGAKTTELTRGSFFWHRDS